MKPHKGILPLCNHKQSRGEAFRNAKVKVKEHPTRARAHHNHVAEQEHITTKKKSKRYLLLLRRARAHHNHEAEPEIPPAINIKD